MSRISAFKHKINKLQSRNNSLEISNMRCISYILRYRQELKEIRNIVKNQDVKIAELEKKSSLKYIFAKEKEIIELKQDLQCKQVEKDSLEFKLNSTESKKFKNRLKKLLVG